MNEIVKKNGVKFGIISGIVSVLITLYAYIFNLQLFGSLWLLLFVIILYLTINISLLIKTKKELNNNFSFKDAFTTYFLCLVIGVSITVIFNIVLFNLTFLLRKSRSKKISRFLCFPINGFFVNLKIDNLIKKMCRL